MPLKEPIKVGLVGAGYISTYHVAALRRLSQVTLVGVCDLDASRAKELAEHAGVPAFASMAELVAEGAQVLHILTPPSTHAKLAIEALERGCHVLVEKPLAEDVEDCRRIEAAASRAGLRVCVNHSLLFDPQIRKALDTVRSGAIGKVVSVDILRSSMYPPYAGGALPPQYRKAGYPFRDLGVHALYVLEAFLGPIEDVDAQWSSLGGEPNLAFDEWRTQVRCRDGMGQFQLSWNVRPMQSQMIIQGTRGVLRVDLFLMFQARRGSLPLPKPAERIINALTDSLKPLIDVPRGVYGFIRKRVLPYHGLQDLVAEFYRSLIDETDVPVTIADAERVVEWTERVAREADKEHEERLAQLTVSDRVPVLVTGASGSLGSEIVRRLRREGEFIRVLVRRIPDNIPEGVEVVVGDLGDPQAVDRAVHGAQRVIHCGAATRGGWPHHQCATIVGTKNILDSCKTHGVEKLIYISSLSVTEWAAKRDTPMTESSPLEPRAEERGAYTRAKLEAEKLVTQFCKDTNLPTVILRPGQIFGGKIKLLTGAVARRVGGLWIMLGDGNMRLPLIYMDDLVDAVMAAMTSDLRSGEIIQLVDEVTPTQNEVLAAAAGDTGRVVRVPRSLLLMLGKLSEWILAPLGRQSPLAVYRLRSGIVNRTYRSENAERLLGWRPRIGTWAAIRRVAGPCIEASPVEVPAAEPVAEPVG